jgi:xylan 1,4-beta-xylosidase
VSALQGGPDDRYKKIVSTCKHFSAYVSGLGGGCQGTHAASVIVDVSYRRPICCPAQDSENSDNTTRTNLDAIVSPKDLVEYYWPAFRSCVERAHAGSIMVGAVGVCVGCSLI